MKRISLSAFLFCITAVAGSLRGDTSPWPFPSRSAPGMPGATSGTLTVAFWNIQWFPGGRPSATKAEETKQITSVQAEIGKWNADIIGMEEIRDFPSAGLAVQKLPGFKVDVCANFPPREGQNEA